MPDMPSFRPATDADAEGVIALVGRVFSEYEGCVLDLDGIDRDLIAPAAHFDCFWVLENERGIVGTCAASWSAPGVVEMKKIYLDRSLRGAGQGRRLIEHIETFARDGGARRIELWSDTRFETAHAVYGRMGYRRGAQTRDLNDPSRTTEYFFSRDL